MLDTPRHENTIVKDAAIHSTSLLPGPTQKMTESSVDDSHVGTGNVLLATQGVGYMPNI